MGIEFDVPWVVALVVLVIFIIISVIQGLISQSINEEKGYSGGFWLGFLHGLVGIDIAKNKTDLRKTPIRQENKALDNRLIAEGGWRCSKCSTVNASYVTTCPCGLAKADNDKPLIDSKNTTSASPADEIAKYKKLLDNGAITEEEYAAKKKQLLGL